ncbi:MAG TPA: PfkB family carbohydrate kinase [Streptosporangiaceae bacterium]|nr:PfkB family carbohydrate kinase [Streptosporangiaceae bacterium]
MSPPIRRLVFAGEAIVDLLMQVPALPERGGDMLATSSGLFVGGGFNTMAAAARQGLPVLYAGGHGTGPWGDLVRSALTAEGIQILRPPDARADTGFDVALVERDGERTFVTSLGAEMLRDPGSWDTVPAGPGDAVYVSGYGLAPAEPGPVLAGWAASLPAEVVLFVDPGPLVADIPADVLGPVLDRCDWCSCSQREAALLTGASDPAGAARQLIARTGRQRPGSRKGRSGVVVRAGAAGCVVAHGDRMTLIPAPPVKAVDTTGAGDAHSGVFLAGLAAGLAPEDAARRANAAAALSTTRTGPATAPTRSALDAFLEETPSPEMGKNR